MIEVERLTKYYGRFAAIKDVSFRVESGEIVGFLGVNGAGKTTTIRILTCFTPASAGKARVLGLDAASDSLEIRKKVGYLPETVPLYPWMRVQGYLNFVAKAKGIPSSGRSSEIERATGAVGLDRVTGKVIKTLSKGFRQRVGLAQAILGDPPVLILDEPTIGLDPRQIREIRHLIRGFAQDHTVMLSTHILPEVSQVCDRVIIINEGSVVAQGTPTNLANSFRKTSRCRVVLKGPESEAVNLLSGMDHVLSVDSSEASGDGEVKLTIETSPDTDVRANVGRLAYEKGWDLLELRGLDATLEDVFISLVTGEAEEAPTAEDLEETEVQS